MASPMAASAAATVRISSAKTWPARSSRWAENADEVDVDGQQDQLDRHQDDDDVLAVEKDAEHAEGEQDGADGQEVTEPDFRAAMIAP